jgi:dihydrolipoamide dehydrogenase
MYDIAIIGAGPGGYTAAIRAAQLGAKVALIEKDSPGGTCLNKGCIPSKAIILSSDKFADLKKLSNFGINVQNAEFDYEEIFNRKNSIVGKIGKNLIALFKSNKIDYFTGSAKILDTNTLLIKRYKEKKTINFKNLILATGSRPWVIPGVVIDHDFIIDSDDILNLKKLPETILIVGSGAIGIEWARILANFDKEVYLTEVASSLAPSFDLSISKRVEQLLKKQRVKVFKITTIEKIEGKTVKLTNGKEITPDKIFIAAGRTPNTDDFGIDFERDEKYIKIDENLRTNVENIYAIGDITGKLMLAHTASLQGIEAVEHILLNKPVKINYNHIPSVIYGKPEIASIGFTEQFLIQNDIDYKVSNVPLTVTGKAIVDDEFDGFVKILADDEHFFGAHIIASEASAMIEQLAVAMSQNISPKALKHTVFAHPTISEAVHEALLGLDNEAIHFISDIK